MSPCSLRLGNIPMFRAQRQQLGRQDWDLAPFPLGMKGRGAENRGRENRMVGVQVESFPNVVSIPFRARQDKLNRSHDLHFSLARNKSSGLGGISCFYP